MKFPTSAGMLLLGGGRAGFFRITGALGVIAIATLVIAPAAAPAISNSGAATGSNSENAQGHFNPAIERSDLPITESISSNRASTVRRPDGTEPSGSRPHQQFPAGGHEDPILAEAIAPRLPALESVPAGATLGCQIEFLTEFTGFLRRYEHWDPGCDPIDDSGAISRRLHISVEGWTYVRLELVSLDNVSIGLGQVEGQSVRPLEPGSHRVLVGGPNVPEAHTFAWRQELLSAGRYEIDLRSHRAQSPSSFTFTLSAQPTPTPPFEFVEISVGYLRSCGILKGGSPLCWGLAIDGISDATAAAPFKQISTGISSHVCALTEDGSAICWGGRATRTVDPTDGSRFVQIESGADHTCAVQDDGQATCWGSNSNFKSSVPAGRTFLQIAASRKFTCGLTTESTAICWGLDEPEIPSHEKFVSIATGERHFCGVHQDGSISCWGIWGMDSCAPQADGLNKCGGIRGSGVPPLPPEVESLAQLSEGEPHCGLRTDGIPICWTPFDSLGLVPPPARKLSQISATATLACGPDLAGSAICWGDDRFGQSSPPTGSNSTGEISWPLLEGVESIAAGSGHACALDRDGRISCWGPNWWQGRFPDIDGFTAISSGSNHSCALHQSGSVTCRGSDLSGATQPPPNANFETLTLGGNFTCGLQRGGSAVCWGISIFSGLFPPREMRFRTIDGSRGRVCGITTQGAAYCWGRNAESHTIAGLDDGDRLIQVAAGDGYTCYLLASGRIRCAGTVDQMLADVPGDSGFIAVSAGSGIACGLHRDGSAACWGSPRVTPLNPPRGERFVDISVGSGFACGARVDGKVSCWGDIDNDLDVPVRYQSPALTAI